MALRSARLAPGLTMVDSPRAPNNKDSASTKMDLPAPVSPENTVKPAEKSRARLSTITKSRICRLCSIGLIGFVGGLWHAIPVQLTSQGRKKAIAGWVQHA